MNKNSLVDIKNKFDLKGYVILEKIFSKLKVKLIKKNLFNYLNKNQKKFNKKKIHFAKNSNQINSVHHLKWPYLKKLRKNKKINLIVKTLLKEKTRDFGAEVFAKPAKVGMSAPIHQDNFYWNLNNGKGVTVWIALNKTTKKNGAVFYFDGSHKYGLLMHKSSFAPGSSQELRDKKILKKFKKTTPNLNEGDILIHHCLAIHGSNKNRSNLSRTGLTLRYVGTSSKINKKAQNKYNRKLKEQLK